MKDVVISEKSKIPLKDVCVIISFVFVAGMAYSEFQNLKKEVAEIKTDVRCLLKKSSKLTVECALINQGPYAGR